VVRKALEDVGRPWNDRLPLGLQGSEAYKYSVPVRCRFCSVVENIVVVYPLQCRPTTFIPGVFKVPKAGR